LIARTFGAAGVPVFCSAVMVDARGERMIVNHLDPSYLSTPPGLPSAGSVGASAVLADTRWPEGALAAFVRGPCCGAASRAGCRPPGPGRWGTAARGYARGVLIRRACRPDRHRRCKAGTGRGRSRPAGLVLCDSGRRRRLLYDAGRDAARPRIRRALVARWEPRRRGRRLALALARDASRRRRCVLRPRRRPQGAAQRWPRRAFPTLVELDDF